MNTLFEIKEIDKKTYEEQIRDFLPRRIIDIHTHVWLDKFRSIKKSGSNRTVTWPSLVAEDNSIEDLMETYRLMFPGKEVIPMIFSSIYPGDDIESANTYISKSAQEHKLPSLIFAVPQWSALELEETILAGQFLGINGYLSFAEHNTEGTALAVPTGDLNAGEALGVWLKLTILEAEAPDASITASLTAKGETVA